MAVDADFRDIEIKDLPKTDFPATVYEEYRVHMKREAYDRMMAHASTTNEVELCGVLIGQVVRDERGPFLKVTAVIEGENANNYGAQVTFTQQTWNHINEVKDREYPKDRIIGWYHTHPGFGVFLSGMDNFIQENFFNMPYQAAIVIETKQDKIGCFIWKGGKSTPLSRMWVGDEEKALAGGSSEEFDASRVGTDDAPAPRASAAPAPAYYPEERGGFGWMFGLILAVLMFMLGLQWGRSQDYRQMYSLLESEIYSVLEFAAVTQTTAQDLGQAREKIATARAKMDGGDLAAAKTELDTLNAELERLQKTYTRPRSQYREELAKVLQARQLLSDRIDKVHTWLQSEEKLQEEQNRCLAEMYVFRLMDFIHQRGIKREELSQVSEVDKAAIRPVVERILRLCPEFKTELENNLPGLLGALYPSAQKPAPKEEEKPKEEALPKQG